MNKLTRQNRDSFIDTEQADYSGDVSGWKDLTKRKKVIGGNGSIEG